VAHAGLALLTCLIKNNDAGVDIDNESADSGEDSEGRGLKSAARCRVAQFEQKDADSARRAAAGSAGYRVREKWPMQKGS